MHGAAREDDYPYTSVDQPKQAVPESVRPIKAFHELPYADVDTAASLIQVASRPMANELDNLQKFKILTRNANLKMAVMNHLFACRRSGTKDRCQSSSSREWRAGKIGVVWMSLNGMKAGLIA